MNKYKILDDNFFDKNKKQPDLSTRIREISKWWFHKRKRYNAVLILFQILIFILFFNIIDYKFGIYNGLLEAIEFTIVANLLYSLGSIVEIIATIFKQNLSNNRQLLWLVGLWFSIFLTAFMYIPTII